MKPLCLAATKLLIVQCLDEEKWYQFYLFYINLHRRTVKLNIEMKQIRLLIKQI